MSLGVVQGREFTATEGRGVCQGWGGWRENVSVPATAPEGCLQDLPTSREGNPSSQGVEVTTSRWLGTVTAAVTLEDDCFLAGKL